MFLFDEVSLFVDTPFEFFRLYLMFLAKRNEQHPIAIVLLFMLIHISLEGEAVFECHIDQIFLADWRLTGQLGDVLLGEIGGYLI
jgi:hypothetical protein